MDNRNQFRGQGRSGPDPRHQRYDPEQRYHRDEQRYAGPDWDEQPGRGWHSDAERGSARRPDQRQSPWSQDAQYGTPHYAGQAYSGWTPDERDDTRDYGRELRRNFGSAERDYGRSYGADYERDLGSAYDRYRDHDRDYGRDAGSEASDPYGYGSRWPSQYSPGTQDTRAQSHAGRSPKGYQRSDEKLREMICERLTESPYIDPSDVTVSVSKGAVTLEGSVSERHLRHQIENLVESCGGVKDIHNHLRVGYAGTQASEDIDSAARTRKSN